MTNENNKNRLTNRIVKDRMPQLQRGWSFQQCAVGIDLSQAELVAAAGMFSEICADNTQDNPEEVLHRFDYLSAQIMWACRDHVIENTTCIGPDVHRDELAELQEEITQERAQEVLERVLLSACLGNSKGMANRFQLPAEEVKS